RLARYYQHPHPALVYLLAMIVENAARARKPVTLCGEMAGAPGMARLLLSLGLRRFSMSVPQIAALRETIPALNCAKLAAHRNAILSAASPESLQKITEKLNAA
ncbi:MAG: putative PEP-binding protein, partial [Gammaproteobacteria bacterium]